jgi:hypothetical protein
VLRLVINPGGRSRIMKIDKALLLLGVDINQPSHLPKMTPEERIQRRKERRRQLQMQREAER